MHDKPAPLSGFPRFVEPEHEESDDCWCGPHVTRVVNDDGTDAGWIITHHSVRGDELDEPGISP